MFVIYAMLAYLVMALCIAAVVLGRLHRRHRPDPSDSLYGGADTRAAEAHLLHRASMHGRRVRFYRSPLIGPDFPWAILRDVFEIATDGATYNVTAEWIYANNPGLAQVVITEQGPELLLSHWACIELFRSLVADVTERHDLIGEFRELMAEAYVLQSAGLSREEFLTLCDVAGRRPHAHSA